MEAMRSFMKVNSDAHMLPYGQQSAERRSSRVTSVPAEAAHPCGSRSRWMGKQFPFSFLLIPSGNHRPDRGHFDCPIISTVYKVNTVGKAGEVLNTAWSLFCHLNNICMSAGPKIWRCHNSDFVRKMCAAQLTESSADKAAHKQRSSVKIKCKRISKQLLN